MFKIDTVVHIVFMYIVDRHVLKVVEEKCANGSTFENLICMSIIMG